MDYAPKMPPGMISRSESKPRKFHTVIVGCTRTQLLTLFLGDMRTFDTYPKLNLEISIKIPSNFNFSSIGGVFGSRSYHFIRRSHVLD